MARMDTRQALDAVIKDRGESYASLSRMLGRNASYIQQFIKRGSPAQLDEEDIARLSLYLDVPPEDLGGRKASVRARRLILSLPVLGAEERGSADESTRRVDGVWLMRISREPAGVALVVVDGDAMNPTLQQGDEVLIQRMTTKESVRDGLYAIRGSSKTLIRRIALEPTRGRISVLTDHPSFPNWSSLTRDAVDVVGRVIWLGLRMP